MKLKHAFWLKKGTLDVAIRAQFGMCMVWLAFPKFHRYLYLKTKPIWKAFHTISLQEAVQAQKASNILQNSLSLITFKAQLPLKNK